MIIHESHHEAMLDIHDYIGLCAPSLLQEALARYLEKNELGHTYTIKLRKILSANYKLFSAALKQLDFKTIDIQGGYFLWCKLPKKYTDGFLFAIDLFEKKQIACVPGIHFSEKGKEYVRFNIAQEQETLIEAILGIKHYTENT